MSPHRETSNHPADVCLSNRHYLLVFVRSTGVLERLEEFDDGASALRERFRVEVADRPDVEVVVLGAASREALEETHARYFSSSDPETGGGLERALQRVMQGQLKAI